jgi:tetratricopeptide (TPR) repeat protein
MIRRFGTRRARLSWLWPLCAALLLWSSVALAVDPSQKLVRRGVELRGRGREQRALELFQRAYEMDQNPEALAYMGESEYSLGLYADAIAHLTAALQLDDPWIRSHRDALERTLERASRKAGEEPPAGSLSREPVVVVIKAGEKPPPSPEQTAQLVHAEGIAASVAQSMTSVRSDLDRVETEWESSRRRFNPDKAKEVRMLLGSIEQRLGQCERSIATIERGVGDALAAAQAPAAD